MHPLLLRGQPDSSPGGSPQGQHRTKLFSPPFATSRCRGRLRLNLQPKPSFPPCFVQTLPPQTTPAGGQGAMQQPQGPQPERRLHSEVAGGCRRDFIWKVEVYPSAASSTHDKDLYKSPGQRSGSGFVQGAARDPSLEHLVRVSVAGRPGASLSSSPAQWWREASFSNRRPASVHTAGEERGPLPMGGHLLASLCFPGRDPEFRSPQGRRLVTLERVSDRVFLTTRMAR